MCSVSSCLQCSSTNTCGWKRPSRSSAPGVSGILHTFSHVSSSSSGGNTSTPYNNPQPKKKNITVNKRNFFSYVLVVFDHSISISIKQRGNSLDRQTSSCHNRLKSSLHTTIAHTHAIAINNSGQVSRRTHGSTRLPTSATLLNCAPGMHNYTWRGERCWLIHVTAPHIAINIITLQLLHQTLNTQTVAPQWFECHRPTNI